MLYKHGAEKKSFLITYSPAEGKTAMEAANRRKEKDKQGEPTLSQHSCVRGWTAHVTGV